jgi:amidophosphoribosyltransferase
MTILVDEKLREECGVAGVFGVENASRVLYLALFALQHRGQEAAGLVTFERGNEEPQSLNLHVHKAFGLVADGINETVLNRLKGSYGVGHVRYSTTGGALVENIQPFQFKTALGAVGISHNGNLTNAREIRKNLESTGSVFQSTSDTEVFVHLIARSESKTIRERIGDALRQVTGAYSLAILTKDALYAARDPRGLRPLVLGKLNGGFVVVSETCALDLIGAEYVRDVEPGEVIEISLAGCSTWYPQDKKPLSFCSFEPIYFARPDSLLYGESIYVRRRRIGEILAEECPADGDVVIPIPDSGVAMAEGFAKKSGIPLAMGLVRNHYIGRTFLQPDQNQRDTSVKLKLNPVKSVLDGKRVIVVDDSLVRGTTAARILKMIRSQGAKEIHFRVGAPPITHSCFYGVDTPNRGELMAAQKTVKEIRAHLNAESLGFISTAGLRKALAESDGKRYCMACFTGEYPEAIGAAVTRQPTDGQGPGLLSRL